ncbi:MAG: phosphatase PAP2 family protein [Spirochaetes bacterium]|nr:phosphatase PAP2 family protein [Spirochaetota bacterium]
MNDSSLTVDRAVRILLLTVSLLLAAAGAFSAESDARRSSPFVVHCCVDIPVIAVSTVTSLAFPLYDRSVPRSQLWVSSRGSLCGMDRWVIGKENDGLRLAGDVGTVVVPAAALCLSLLEYPSWGWSGVIEDFLIAGEALAVSAVIRTFVCRAFPRPRPYMYDLNLKREHERNYRWDIQSFFSGHASSCFAATTALSFVYTVRNPGSIWVPVLWAGGILTSTFVTISRPLAGEHFWSDALVGSAAGILCGIAIPVLHLASIHNGDSEVRIVITAGFCAASCSF